MVDGCAACSHAGKQWQTQQINTDGVDVDIQAGRLYQARDGASCRRKVFNIEPVETEATVKIAVRYKKCRWIASAENPISERRCFVR